MLDAPAFPGVGDVHQSIARLDDRRIGEAARRIGVVFQHQDGVPRQTVVGERHIEGAAALVVRAGADVVIVNQQLAAIAQRHGIRAGIRVGQIEQGHLSPGRAAVVRPDLKNLVIVRATHGFERAVGQEQKAGLNRADGCAVVQRAGCGPRLPKSFVDSM